MRRRQVLKATGAGLLGVGSLKAVDNTLLGYGEFGNGENLRSQDLARAVGAHLGTAPLGDAHRFEFHEVDAFFDRMEAVEPAAETVDALRGEFSEVEPDMVTRFTEARATNVEGVVHGLVGAFRDVAYYDVPRYVAGSVQDNVLFDSIDLRAPFRSDVSFEALIDREGEVGMFCYEFTWRSIEALHAAEATEQDVPVFGGWVIDDRHKHVYTVIASAYRDAEGEMVVPVTFVDYTHTTLYDDLHLTGMLGEELGAYDARHRATNIWWTM